jgi:hypothetical protein
MNGMIRLVVWLVVVIGLTLATLEFTSTPLTMWLFPFVQVWLLALILIVLESRRRCTIPSG